MQKEIPILFSTPMVLAILAGRKTMTRRIKGLDEYNETPDEFKIVPRDVPSGFQVFKKANTLGVEHFKTYWDDVKCPYGKAGDILWVREEHYQYGYWTEKKGVKTKTGRQKWMFIPLTDEILFEAPESYRKGRHHKDPHTAAWHKRLARFMPKSAARIWLEVMDIRVERLQDITEEDAKAEGLTCLSKDGGITYKYGIPDTDGLPGVDNTGWPWQEWRVSPSQAFKTLWEKINGSNSWASNPWVWVVSFKVLSTTGKPDLKTSKVVA